MKQIRAKSIFFIWKIFSQLLKAWVNKKSSMVISTLNIWKIRKLRKIWKIQKIRKIHIFLYFLYFSYIPYFPYNFPYLPYFLYLVGDDDHKSNKCAFLLVKSVSAHFFTSSQQSQKTLISLMVAFTKKMYVTHREKDMRLGAEITRPPQLRNQFLFHVRLSSFLGKSAWSAIVHVVLCLDRLYKKVLHFLLIHWQLWPKNRSLILVKR